MCCVFPSPLVACILCNYLSVHDAQDFMTAFDFKGHQKTNSLLCAAANLSAPSSSLYRFVFCLKAVEYNLFSGAKN